MDLKTDTISFEQLRPLIIMAGDLDDDISFDENANIYEDLAFESIGVVFLYTLFGDEYGIEIPEEEEIYKENDTIEKLIRFVNEQRSVQT